MRDCLLLLPLMLAVSISASCGNAEPARADSVDAALGTTLTPEPAAPAIREPGAHDAGPRAATHTESSEGAEPRGAAGPLDASSASDEVPTPASTDLGRLDPRGLAETSDAGDADSPASGRLPPARSLPDAAVEALPSSGFVAQRAGDPVRGRALLLNNGTPEVPILSCGVPESVIKAGALDKDWAKEPRIADRRDAELPYNLNYVNAPSGVRVLTTNCLHCHASTLGGEVIIGLPSANRDFTQPGDLSGLPGLALQVGALLLDAGSQVELARILKLSKAVEKFPAPDTIGLNPADGVFGALAMHRDPDTLVWRDTPDPAAGPPPTRNLFTDVPAWWNTHRRPGLFHTGFGRGDHARIMMSAALFCLADQREAERIDAYFADVRAYIDSLRAPKYQDVAHLPIDAARAARGQAHFVERCQGCHGGKAGEGPEPVQLVDLSVVGTDSLYTEVTQPGSTLPEGASINYYFEFFNRSWYGKQGHAGKLQRPEKLGYLPPPLDGIWATAPYFHNGSVPTLDAVLDPTLRPTIFRRSFDPKAYDFERAGWPYEEVTEKGSDVHIYDTTRLGNGNQGHLFAADLSPDQRADLLAYLKTF